MNSIATKVFVTLAAVATACGPPVTKSSQALDPRPPAASRAPLADPWGDLETGWTRLADPPLVRARAASVWTGRELVFWGGDTGYGGAVHKDGASYDPETDSWKPLPPSPLYARTLARAAWTGAEVIISGGSAGGEHAAFDDGAAYNPSTGSWRMLADGPLDTRVPVAAVWTGTELILWGDIDREREARDGAAYDPATDRWRTIAPAPIALNQASAVWTGSEMIVYGAQLDNNNASRERYAQGVAYNPVTDSWRQLPEHPLSPQASSAVWLGNVMLAWDYGLKDGIYDPAANRWEPLEELPFSDLECYPASAVADDTAFAWYCGGAALFDPRDGGWYEMPTPDTVIAGRPVSAGSVVLFAGAAHESTHNSLWAFKPPDATTEGVLRFVAEFMRRRVSGSGAEDFLAPGTDEFGKPSGLAPLYDSSYDEFQIVFVDGPLDPRGSFEIGVRVRDASHVVIFEETLFVGPRDDSDQLAVRGGRGGLDGP